MTSPNSPPKPASPRGERGLFRVSPLAAYVILVGFLVVGVARVELLARDGAQAHDSLCALKLDLKARHDDLAIYLEEHPRGIVSPKTNAVIISRADLERSKQQQEATLASLSELDC